MNIRSLKIGTRGSDLALAQAHFVQNRLKGENEIHIIQTSGDRFQNQPLNSQSEIGLFTKEIEQELLRGDIDLAVHSLKDLPNQLTPGLTLGAILSREEVSDLLLVQPAAYDCEQSTLPLKHGASVGASSLRRQALLSHLRPDLKLVSIRGNVPTRVRKARNSECDAVILARAGLIRLKLNVSPLLAFDLNPKRFVPAPGQAAIAIEIRESDRDAKDRVATLDHTHTRACVEVERILLRTFGGGCHAPFGAYAEDVAGMARVFVAAPVSDGTHQTRCFEANDLNQVRSDAEAWISSGRIADPVKENAQWLWKPARPWY